MRNTSRRLRFENLEGRELLAVVFDHTFKNGGEVHTAFTADMQASANELAVQKDGKIILAGSQNDEMTSSMVLARYNPAGDLDASFGTNGRLELPPIGTNPRA